MSTYVPKEVQAGLDRARLARLAKGSRLRIDVDGQIYRVLRMWKTGFSMDAASAPSQVRGHVDLYDGARHLFQCLVIASEEDAGEVSFEFKRLTAVSDAPALDFVKAKDAPVALLANGS
ncbi:hypothetical protein [Ascidiaceihabitans sp.]|uniref:hypothetical protein n=1 Tax=Ascidiaceihabitans sp. TaxID=1872644 RepID=UPI00329990B1